MVTHYVAADGGRYSDPGMMHRLLDTKIEPHRERFRSDPSEDRAIKYAGVALLAFNEGSIDDTCCADILREVADWLATSSTGWQEG